MILDLMSWWYDLSRDLAHITDENALLSQISRFGMKLGFSHTSFCANRARDFSQDDMADILFDDPKASLERYMTARYLSIDSKTRASARACRALVWGDSLTPEAQSLCPGMTDFGLQTGIAQSGWSRGGLATLLSLARSTPPISQHEADLLQPYLTILSQFATSRLQDLIDKRQTRNDLKHLSPREIEVLKLSAAGKTASDLSLHLGITYATVQFHLQNAKKKLGVATKIQAIVCARQLGVVD
ncbi:LuxR C-terminal-related transcriptional regulator [Burkholderia stabilis]|uniref:LuxR C-terminal-related transcriptional regulator n=1 Tax=Burkholderia stabilis TaxID=95485 RepID=UPI0031330FDC